jgi:hypothetical protein
MGFTSAPPAEAYLGLERPLFGQILRQIVPLRREQLAEALQEQARSGGRLGAILQGKGWITRDQVMEVLRRQACWVARAFDGDLRLPYPAFLSVCMPAFNEEANIVDTLDAACAILPEFVDRFEVVVVDDGSRDNTAKLIARYAEQDNRVRLVRHERNRGYGSAVTTGLRASRGDLVFFTDSDGQFSFLDMPQLLSLLDSADVAVGYRYCRADHWRRRLNAWGWNRLVRLFLGVRVRDLDCAYKVFRRSVLERLSLTSTGAAINAEMLTQFVHGGLTIRETPVTHYPRYQGAPTGAAFHVILKAFRELPGLWKYRSTPSLRDAAPRARDEEAALPPLPAPVPVPMPVPLQRPVTRVG